jgi:hypothetical protein
LPEPVGAAMRMCCAILIVALVATAGCRTADKMVQPSNFRNWTPEQALLPHAEIDGQQVTVHNIRNCQYFSDDTYLVNYYDKSFDLSAIRGVDFLMVPFKGMPSLAHTMLSFELVGPDGTPEYLAVSVETRKEKDEQYAAWKGSARQYELMYVVADERDVIKQRTNFRDEDVYLYDTTATPDVAQQLFVDVMARTNELASQPEFYDTITNNCTTNIVRHINDVRPNRITYDVRSMLPGLSDKLAFDQGLLVPYGTFEETKQRAYINPLAEQFAEREDFSQLIRRR